MAIVDTLPNGFWPLQIVGAMNIIERRAHLLADHPGAGKTLQAMLACELDGLFNRPSSILITAPKTACQLTWAPEIRKRIESQYAVVVADLTGALGKRGRGGAPRKTAPSVAERNQYLVAKSAEAIQLGLPLIVLVNFEGIRWAKNGPATMPALFPIIWDAIFIDEAHQVLPTKADTMDEYTLFWRGLTQLQTTPRGLRVSMTGTPDRGKLENRYGHWKFMFRAQFRNYKVWEEGCFVKYYDENRGEWRIGGVRSEQAWAAYERVNMTRRTKAEMLKGLPEKQWADEGAVVLPLTPAQEEQLGVWSGELEAKVDEGELTADAARAAAHIRGRQMAVCTWDQYENRKWKPRRAGVEASNVLAWLVNFLEERGHHPQNWDATLGKVVITSYFTEVLHWLADELETLGYGRIAIMEGDTPLHEKQRIEQEFQRGEMRILLFSGHLGVSINLDAADDMVFTDLVHDPDVIEQTEDRIHRASRMHQVTYWRLVSEGTIMEDVVATVDSRYRETRKMYDGTRGVAYLRKLVGSFEGLMAA